MCTRKAAHHQTCTASVTQLVVAMGKRKSARPVMPAKKREKLADRFKCPFCEDDDSVTCKVNKKLGLAGILCHTCKVKFKASIDDLTEPIDVYHIWIDECERVNK